LTSCKRGAPFVGQERPLLVGSPLRTATQRKQMVERAGRNCWIVPKAVVALRQEGTTSTGIIGGDDHPIGRYIQSALTTFSAETERAGRRMAEILLARLDGATTEELQEVWPPEIILRASDGPPREVARSEGG